MDKLEGRIRNHDREIEKMCNHHFQGFVDSITELLKVRGEAQKLKVQKEEMGVWGNPIKPERRKKEKHYRPGLKNISTTFVKNQFLF